LTGSQAAHFKFWHFVCCAVNPCLDFFSGGVYPEPDGIAVFFFVKPAHLRRSKAGLAARDAVLPIVVILLPGVLWSAACTRPRKVITAARKPAVSPGPDEPSRALPPDFDRNLPVLPGSIVEHVRTPKGAMREILFGSNASVDELIRFYKTGLQSAGYRITSTLKMPARRTWSCDFHKEGQQASIMLFPSENDKSRMTIDLVYEMPARDQRPVLPEEKFDIVGPGEIAQTTIAGGKGKRN
jgi:hypothetical protein